MLKCLPPGESVLPTRTVRCLGHIGRPAHHRMMSQLLARANSLATRAIDKVKEVSAEIKDRVVEELEKPSPAPGPGLTLPPAAAAPRDAAPALVADSRAQKLHLCGHDIEGVSIAGMETCILLPRAKVAFDIGRCPQRAVFHQTVLITHGHLDHIGGLPFHASSRMLLDLPPSKIALPPHYKEAAGRYLQVSNELQGNPPLEYDLIALEPGQELALASGYIARPFPTTHTLPSQGYVLYSQRKKLKAELQGRSQEEIRDLRLAGVDVTETIEVPEVAFTGDTTAECFDNPGMDDVFRAKLLIVEMTFLDDSVTVEQAREKGHMHIADFVARAHKLQNEAILFVHFSARYNAATIKNAISNYLPPSLAARCTPFLNGWAQN